jgi:predicted nucleic acid-binding protein
MKSMKVGTRYFADSYALIELLKGNVNYEPYSSSQLVTMKFVVAEVYYYLLREELSYAQRAFSACAKMLTPTTLRALRAGTAFKFKYKKQKLSYVDCVGYALAKELGIPFLTGDEKFKDKENVEFVR